MSSKIRDFIRRIPTPGIKFELRMLKKKLGNQPRKTPGAVEIFGWKLDYVDKLALLSSLEILVCKGWNDFKTENNVPMIIDCGANIGISVLNYKRKFPNAKIVAFEPDPLIIPVLKRNLTVNHASDVTLVEAAVWVKLGELDFYIEGADGSRLTVDHDFQTGTTKVKTIDLLDHINVPIDLIKMDIEGAELEVIPHIESKLNMVQNLIIECHVNGDQAGKFGQLLEVLSDSGFRVSLNSIGQWRDLVRDPAKLPDEFDQYFLVAATR
jgi:FkbM family methyltransferase